jgi:hypothetical protein
LLCRKPSAQCARDGAVKFQISLIAKNSPNSLTGAAMADTVSIFISYKKDDVILASAIDGVFGDFGGNRVETYMAAKLLPSTKWAE